MTQHTALPWNSNEHEHDTPFQEIEIKGADGRRVCRIWLDDAPLPDYNQIQRANARLIVQAVNYHKRLQALLEEVITDNTAFGTTTIETLNEIEATLFKLDNKEQPHAKTEILRPHLAQPSSAKPESSFSGQELICSECGMSFDSQLCKGGHEDLCTYIKRPRPPKAQPMLTKHQPCRCVICTCEHETQCHGCGAKHCGTHPVGQIPEPVYIRPPKEDSGDESNPR